MTMTIFEKKALYSFGCPNREATVERLHMIAGKVLRSGRGFLCSGQVQTVHSSATADERGTQTKSK